MSEINLYSDTQTLPTPEMVEAMARAELGDDVLRADPTVNRLEERVAELFEKEAALLLPSGTMANLVALLSHGRGGDEVYLDPKCHVYNYEAGAMCSVGGYTPRFYELEDGRPSAAALERALRVEDDHFPAPRLLWLENTHNAAGGLVLDPEVQSAMVRVGREHGLGVHIDGARLFNAAVALGRPVARLAAEADTVSFCLSKGLSCPVGSLLVGSAARMHLARRIRKRLGGGMRQAGVIAACGLVALDTTVERLADDHRNARELALGLAGIPGVAVDPSRVETNMIFVDISGWGVDCIEAHRLLRAEGVLVSEMEGPMIRLVTHRMVGAEVIPAVADAFRRVAERRARS